MCSCGLFVYSVLEPLVFILSGMVHWTVDFGQVALGYNEPK